MIRTLVTLSGYLAFQASAIGHSATCPILFEPEPARSVTDPTQVPPRQEPAAEPDRDEVPPAQPQASPVTVRCLFHMSSLATKWRRARDLNPHILSDNGLANRCGCHFASPPMPLKVVAKPPGVRYEIDAPHA